MASNNFDFIQDSKDKDPVLDISGNILKPRGFCSCQKNNFKKSRSVKDQISQVKCFHCNQPSNLHGKELCDQVNLMELPQELISLITDKLIYIRDIVRFGAVCSISRSVYLQNRLSIPRQPPLLMLPTKHNLTNQMRSLYNVAEKTMWDFQVRVPQDAFCQGSCFGWLLMVTRSFEVYLLNPFLVDNNEIQLPPLTAFEPEEDDTLHVSYIDKAVLSANPTYDRNYTVFVIHGHRKLLAFLKPGDKKWTNLNIKYKLFNDILPHGDQFYAVDFFGRVFDIDLNRRRPKMKIISPRSDGTLYSENKYLIECCGDFLLILRFRSWRPSNKPLMLKYHFASGFRILKLDRGSKKWLEVKSLDNNILFLGDNCSFAISASCFPECKPNSIYFTDDYHEGYYSSYYDNLPTQRGAYEMGVFSLEDGSIEPHYTMEGDVLPPPVWIELPQ